MGEGYLTLDGGHNPIELQGEPLDPAQLLSSGEIEIGRIEVKQETFRATISPRAGEDCFLLKHFGFEPLLPDKEMDDADEARRERLRSLGYIN
jgi:hypothetical protein